MGYLITMEWEYSSTSHVISSKPIVNYLSESGDENITVTGSESDFDGSDYESQISERESKNQNTTMFRKSRVHELKKFRTGKKWMIHMYAPKFLLVLIGKLLTLYMVEQKHIPNQINIHIQLY